MASNGHLLGWKMLSIFNFSNSVVLLFLVLFSLCGTNVPDQCDKCLEWKNKGETKCEYPYVKLECQNANFTIEYEAILLANLEAKSKPGKRFELGPPLKCTMNSNGLCRRMNIQSELNKVKVDFEKQIVEGAFLNDFDNFLALGLDLASKNGKIGNCHLINYSNSNGNDNNGESTTIKIDNSSISGGEVTSTSMSTQTLARTLAFTGNLLMQVLEGFLLGGEIEEGWNKLEIEVDWNDPKNDGKVRRFLNFTADKDENKIYIELPEYVESKEIPLNDMIKPDPFNLMLKRLNITGNADLEMNNIQLELVLNDESLGEFLLDRRNSRNLTVQIPNNEPKNRGFVPNSIYLKKIYLTPTRLSDRKEGYGMWNGTQIIINAKIPKSAEKEFKIHIIRYELNSNLPMDVDECYTPGKCCCWIEMRIWCNLKENFTKIDYMTIDKRDTQRKSWTGKIQLVENPFYAGMKFKMNITSLTPQIFHIRLQDMDKNELFKYNFTTQFSKAKRIEFKGEIIVIEQPEIVNSTTNKKL